MDRKKGTTIIEVLVVSGIIGILLALIAPAIIQARATTRSLTCQNNLRQLGIATSQYLDAHQMFPPLYLATPNEHVWWCCAFILRDQSYDGTQGHLSEFLQSPTGKLACPAASSEIEKRLGGQSGFYGYNYRGLSPITYLPDGRMSWSPRRLREIQSPSKTVCLADSATIWQDWVPGPVVLIEFAKIEPPSERTATVHFRHQLVANVIFVDGHAERFSMPAIQIDTFGEQSEKHNLSTIGVSDTLWLGKD